MMRVHGDDLVEGFPTDGELVLDGVSLSGAHWLSVLRVADHMQWDSDGDYQPTYADVVKYALLQTHAFADGEADKARREAGDD